MNIYEIKKGKNLKKINKIKLRLSDKNKIIFTSESTLIIIVANAGLGNAVKRSELEDALRNMIDNIAEIVLPPRESFAILITKDFNSSKVLLKEMEAFLIETPDFKLRPSVQAFCIAAECVSENVLKTVDDFVNIIPNGLNVITNFINDAEESELINFFVTLHNEYNHMKNRIVLHFGFEFNYLNNRVDATSPLFDKPIPEICKYLLKRLEDQSGKAYSSFDQLTVNIYQPGDGIPPHVDTHSVFTDEIISISLGSDIIMEFFNPISIINTNVELKARSVCIMSGESRYLWHHGIAARKTDLVLSIDSKSLTRRKRGLRVSLTFRKVKMIPNCNCTWPQSCDISNRKNEMDIENPSKLEEEFVHKVYEEIADHFSSTRHSMWPKVRNFIFEQKFGSVGADIGCGNGKYFPAIIQRGFLLGSDMSFNLCKIASEANKVDVIQSNCLQLPYRAKCCDYFISIAVLHHLSTEERRLESLEKMTKLLCFGGKGLIYVWAKEQKNSGVLSNYINVKSTDVKSTQHHIKTETGLPVHVNRTEFSSSDMLVPWCNKNDKTRVLTRYYHLFVEGELESLCNMIPNVRIVQSWYDSGNWATVIQKI